MGKCVSYKDVVYHVANIFIVALPGSVTIVLLLPKELIYLLFIVWSCWKIISCLKKCLVFMSQIDTEECNGVESQQQTAQTFLTEWDYIRNHNYDFIRSFRFVLVMFCSWTTMRLLPPFFDLTCVEAAIFLLNLNKNMRDRWPSFVGTRDAGQCVRLLFAANWLMIAKASGSIEMGLEIIVRQPDVRHHQATMNPVRGLSGKAPLNRVPTLSGFRVKVGNYHLWLPTGK